jgi:hypothetical protein
VSRLAAILRRACRAAALTSLLGLAPAAPLAAQSASGALRVALTILPPVTTGAPDEARMTIARDGTATIQTPLPLQGPTSHILMAAVSGIDDRGTLAGRVAVRGGQRSPRTLTLDVASPIDDGAGAAGITYVVRAPSRVQPQPAESPALRVHISYLAVAGT